MRQRYDSDAGGVTRARCARWGRGVGLAVIGMMLLPATALACMCVTNAPRETLERGPNRAAVFIGQALEVDERPDSLTNVRVKFLVTSSWRGPRADTVTLRVTHNAPCAYYTEGGRYLVFADLLTDRAAGPQLVSGTCDEAMRLQREEVRGTIASLGRPRWTAPPIGKRKIDHGSVKLGTALARAAHEGSVVFVPPSAPEISRIEIGDYSGKSSPSGGGLLYLKPGLYQLRVTWTDGSRVETYLSIRCRREPPHVCQNFTYFPGMHVPELGTRR